MAGTCEPTWVGFKDNSEIAGDLGVRNMNFGGSGVSTSNLFKIILPNTIHKSKKKLRK